MCQNIIPKVLSTTSEEMYREEGVLDRFLMYVLVPRVFCTRGENIIFKAVLTPATIVTHIFYARALITDTIDFLVRMQEQLPRSTLWYDTFPDTPVGSRRLCTISTFFMSLSLQNWRLFW